MIILRILDLITVFCLSRHGVDFASAWLLAGPSVTVVTTAICILVTILDFS